MAQLDAYVEGLEEAQEGVSETFDPKRFGRKIEDITSALYRAVLPRVPVLTGALKNAQRLELRGVDSMIYTDPNVVNPDGSRPAEYAQFQDDFYAEAIEAEWHRIAIMADEVVKR